MDTNKIISVFTTSWLGKSKEYIGKPEKIKQLLSDAVSKLNIGALAMVKGQLLLLISYLGDIATGKYKDYSTANLAMAIAGLVYLVSPLDLVPDAIPLLGWGDDATVLAFVLKNLDAELERYKQWKS